MDFIGKNDLKQNLIAMERSKRSIGWGTTPDDKLDLPISIQDKDYRLNTYITMPRYQYGGEAFSVLAAICHSPHSPY